MQGTNQLLPYQQRVVDERNDLDSKLGSLLTFIGTPVFHSLDGADRALLKQQADVMAEYSSILSIRIARF